MKLADFYRDGRFGLSFELYPPKTPAGQAALMRNVDVLRQYDPSYITCTYGAGGSTRAKTLDIVCEVKDKHGLPVASHLTCVGSTVDELRAYLEQASSRGVDAIVALRGDPPQGETQFTAVDGGLRYANELVELIRAEFPDFGVAVAGYPEVHQEATSPEADLENLKRKVDCGAEIVITQLFYDNVDYFRFQERYLAAGIQVPLIPGILPVTNLKQIQRITQLCKATLPQSFIDRLGEQDDAEWQMQVGIEFATEQVQDLISAGAAGAHFYVLNQSRATGAVLNNVELPGRCV